MSDSKSQKSNIKNSNPKIGRPAKTDQEQQFKNHYLQNRKKFEIECQLLVYIHQIFFEQIPTHPTNMRVPVSEMVKLFQKYNSKQIYMTLAKMNQQYFKNSSLFPQEKLRYTSIIDLCYLLKQVKMERMNKLSTHQLLLILYFFFFVNVWLYSNEKVVNRGFHDYFQKRFEIFRNGMINGPNSDLNKMDTLIISLALEIAIREDVMIEQQVDDDEGDGNYNDDGDDDQQIQPEINQMLPQKSLELQKQPLEFGEIKMQKPQLDEAQDQQSL